MSPALIKKYSNRRLYDTDASKYVTLDELADKIQGGTDVRVIDAKSGEDLTQVTLTQIIIEGRGLARLLPVPLLMQLIRLGDDALAEFFSRYVSAALETYLQAKRGAQLLNPFAVGQMPFPADALNRMWMASPFARAMAETQPDPGPVAEAHAPPPPDDDSELAKMRRELEELKRAVQGAVAKKSDDDS